jgi:hypothetical protein
MALYARSDKFGVVQANHLLTGGVNRADAMGDQEVRVKLVDGDYVWYIRDGDTEKIIEKTRSIGRNYHGCDVIDENNFIFIPIFIDAAHTSVKLKLWGLSFPTFHYTELPQHNHGGQTFASPAHSHTQGTHAHTFAQTVTSGSAGAITPTFTGSAGNTGYTDIGQTDIGWNHRHSYTPAGTISAIPNHAHSVAVNGWTSTDGAGAIANCSDTTAIPNAGINGGALNDTQKTTVDILIKAYVSANPASWGSAKDKNTTNWESFANINAPGGTDEIDIFTYLTAGAFGYIKIEEPTAKTGGKIAWHLSLS